MLFFFFLLIMCAPDEVCNSVQFMFTRPAEGSVGHAGLSHAQTVHATNGQAGSHKPHAPQEQLPTSFGGSVVRNSDDELLSKRRPIRIGQCSPLHRRRAVGQGMLDIAYPQSAF